MNSSVRTDLAIENAEMFQETEELQGIRIEEERGQVSDVYKRQVQSRRRRNWFCPGMSIFRCFVTATG